MRVTGGGREHFDNPSIGLSSLLFLTITFTIMNTKQGQVEITFNWIYIFVAGAVILLFFFGLVLKQKSVSEQQLQLDLTKIFESIITAARNSEKTKTTIDTHLDAYTLFFSCEDQVAHYGVKGTAAPAEDVFPVFAPAEIQSAQLSFWSLPYKLPFKVIDFLFVTAPNVKYIFIGSNDFVQEFIDETKFDPQTKFRINRQQLGDRSLLSQLDPGKNEQIRIVDVSATVLNDGAPIPSSLQQLADEQVTGVAFPAQNTVDYYQKNGVVWKKINSAPINIISLGGERDAARYAAVFAGSDQAYRCGMQQAFRRLSYLNEVYAGTEITRGESGGKLNEMKVYYDTSEHSLTDSCSQQLTLLQSALQSHQNAGKACLIQDAACVDLLSSAQRVREINQELIDQGCLALY